LFVFVCRFPLEKSRISPMLVRTYMDKPAPKKRVSDLGIPTFSKTDVRYWRDRVYKPVSVRGNVRIEGEHFAIKLQAGGKRMTLGLHTPNRDEAASRARRMYLDLVAGGWESMLDKHRPEAPKPQDPAKNAQNLNFGEYIALVRSKNLLSEKAIVAYSMRLRGIVADIVGIRSAKKYGAGRKAWADKVDAVPLAAITPDDIRKWKRDVIAKAGNVIARKHATTAVNSTLRQARSLFGERKVLKFIQIPHNPFKDVEFESRMDMRFHGAGIDAPTLLRRAMKDLGQEELKAFLLAIAIGLRRKEADLLEWSSFNFAESTIEIKPTENYGLKTEDSAATMSLDPEFMVLFRGWYAKRKGNFVLESDHPPRPDANYFYYRADHTFDALVDWLRLQGIDQNKPFHVLRKLFGSLVVEKHGLFAASSALRHTSVELTSAYYLDHSVRKTTGLGSVLSGAQVSEIPDHSDRMMNQKVG
jgi:integrase